MTTSTAAPASRLDAFAAALPRPRLGRGSGDVPRAMVLAGSVALPLGLVMVFLGWYGAARTPYLFEQVPYLVSGGLLGLGLVLTGGFLFFGSWVARSAREQRETSEQLLEVLQAVREELAGLPAAMAAVAPAPTEVVAPAQRVRRGSATGSGAGRNGSSNGAKDLVATARGSMLHRPDCTVVANREDLHAVGSAEAEGLSACRLCDPYAAVPRTRA